MPTIEIDGRTLEVEAGKMIIQAADESGIFIPRFCYHEQLSIAANCRMCLVEVERAPKPLPACATPVADGMKVFTASATAVDAQKGTMEFLLINHPLDCPICDQGGECPLQDQALGYGKDVSRYTEKKRVVDDQDLGPLIATEMTRCIHCTRCVRFGQEVAGIMELGATGRSEHMKIGTYVGRTVDSEVSGNMIDLCPVGALTSKPYRYSARAWELTNVDSISPHDCVGTNLNVQSLRGEVRRVLPRSNTTVNECWLADRDRYSYVGVNSDDRLSVPMVRHAAGWQETDWETALDHAVTGLRRVIDERGADQIGALISPTATLEEFYLAQKLLRGLGSGNIDHRLRQRDFRDDDVAPVCPGLERPLAALDTQKAILLIGSNIRKEQPLLGVRVRKMYRQGGRVMAVNPMHYDFHFPLQHAHVVPPAQMPHILAAIAAAVADHTGVPLPSEIADWTGSLGCDATSSGIAATLIEHAADGTIVLGTIALQHADFSVLRAIAQWLATHTGCALGVLVDGNGMAAWLAGAVPQRGPKGAVTTAHGRHARDMLEHPLGGYLTLGIDPSLDCLDGGRAGAALESAFVVSLAAFRSGQDQADVLLPMVPFTETEGAYVNCEGRIQITKATVPPRGAARPAWKILRVLGNLLGRPGFDYVSAADVRAEVDVQAIDASARIQEWRVSAPRPQTAGDGDIARIVDVPLYAVDAVVRHSAPLQATADNPPPAVHLSAEQAARLEFSEETDVDVHSDGTTVRLPVVVDPRVPDQCVYIPAGYLQTIAIGAAATVRLTQARD